MLDGLDLILRWFVDEIHPRFGETPWLFCDEGGGAIHRGTIRNRLRYLLDLEKHPSGQRFSPHGLRHACATRNYERGVDLVAIHFERLFVMLAQDAARIFVLSPAAVGALIEKQVVGDFANLLGLVARIVLPVIPVAPMADAVAKTIK